MAKLPHRTSPVRSIIVLAATTALLALITSLDYLTGPEVGVALFYMVPVALAAWFDGRWSGPIIALLAAAAWYVAEVNAGPVYTTVWAPIWNSFSRFVFFLTASILVREYRAKRALAAELTVGERKYRSLFENAAVGVGRLSEDGRWLEANDWLCHQLGYSRDELRELTAPMLVHPEDFDAAQPLLERIIRAEISTCELDQRWLGKDGRVINVHLSLSAVRDDEGALLYLVAVVEDITARKEAEGALQTLNSELEDRVEERTSELLSLNHELESFNFSIAHDLRTPLRGINGYSRVLLDEYGKTLDETGRRYLQRVEENATIMGELIDALLSLSQLGRGELHLGPVDLSAIAVETALELQSREPDREVQFEVAPGLSAWGDYTLLRTVVTNLLENAWKFSRDIEHARVSVGMEWSEEGWVYHVRDNGAGFDPAHAGKLFEPFQRLHRPGEFEGRGVGLATVERIVKRHGGRVWAEAMVGKGATVYFTLGQRDISTLANRAAQPLPGDS